MQSPPLMAIDKIEDMELHREAWEDTLLGFDFWKDAFKWCKEIDDRKKAEQEADREALNQLTRHHPAAPVVYSESEYSVPHSSDSEGAKFALGIASRNYPEEGVVRPAAQENKQAETHNSKKSFRRLGAPFQFDSFRRPLRPAKSQWRLEELAQQVSEDDQGEDSGAKKNIYQGSPTKFSPLSRSLRASASRYLLRELAVQEPAADDKGEGSSPTKSIRGLGSPIKFNSLRRSIRTSTSRYFLREPADQKSAENDQDEGSSPPKSVQLESPLQPSPIKRAIRASRSLVRSFSASLKGSRSTNTFPPVASPKTQGFLPAPIAFEPNRDSADIIFQNPDSPSVTYLYSKRLPSPAVPHRGPGRPPPPSRHPLVNPLTCHPPYGPPNLEPIAPPVQFERPHRFPRDVSPVPPGFYPLVDRAAAPHLEDFEGIPHGGLLPDDSSSFPVEGPDPSLPHVSSCRVDEPWEHSPSDPLETDRFPSRVTLLSEVSSALSPQLSPYLARFLLPVVNPLGILADPRRVAISVEVTPPISSRDTGRSTPPSRRLLRYPLTSPPPERSSDFQIRLTFALRGSQTTSGSEIASSVSSFRSFTPPYRTPPKAPRLAFATLHREPGLIMIKPPFTPERRLSVSAPSPPPTATQSTEAVTHELSDSTYASPPGYYVPWQRRISASSSQSISSGAPTTRAPEPPHDSTPVQSPTSPPDSPIEDTLSMLERLRLQIVVDGQAAEESVDPISPSPGSPSGQHADPFAAEAARRNWLPGYDSVLCLIEWYYIGHSWDDISRDTDVLQLKLSSENIVSPTGALAPKHRMILSTKDTRTLTPSQPSSPDSALSSGWSVAGPSNVPDYADGGIDSAELSAALKAAIESSYGCVPPPTTPKAAKDARSKDTSPMSTFKIATKDKGKAPITGEAPSKANKLAVRWKWPERKSSLPTKYNEEKDGFDIDFHANQLLPLPEFRRLHTLKLTGMLASHQPHIWLACWVNPNLRVLILEMKDRPHVYEYVGNFKPKWIAGDWVRNNVTSGHSHYFGDEGKGRLEEKRYGTGEYLDKRAIEQAKVRAMQMGYRQEHLSIVHLVLSGFVVDSGPFVLWFGEKLRTIHFKRDCIDAGFWLPPRLAGQCGICHSDRRRWEILEVSGQFLAGAAPLGVKTARESLLMLDTSRWFQDMSGGAFLFAAEEEDEEVDAVSQTDGLAIEAIRAWDRSDRFQL